MHTRQGFFWRIGVKNWRNFPLPSNTNKAGDAKEERDGLSGRSKVNEGIESCGFMYVDEHGLLDLELSLLPLDVLIMNGMDCQNFVGLIKWFQGVFNSGSCLMVNHGTVGLLGHAANSLPPQKCQNFDPGPNCCWRFPGIAWFGPARHKEGGATWYQRVRPGLVYLTFQEVRTYEQRLPPRYLIYYIIHSYYGIIILPAWGGARSTSVLLAFCWTMGTTIVDREWPLLMTASSTPLSGGIRVRRHKWLIGWCNSAKLGGEPYNQRLWHFGHPQVVESC